jgi:DNA-binding NtrC family response regulator
LFIAGGAPALGRLQMFRPTDRCSLRILLVDDDSDLHLASAEVLRAAGHEVRTAGDGEQAREIVASLKVDVLLTAVRLPKLDGLSLFRLTRQQSPTTTIILVAAACDVQDALAAVKEGAHDYFRRPVATEDIRRCIEAIAGQRSMQRQLVQVRVELARLDSPEQLVGRSAVMCQLMDRVNAIAFSDAAVLLLGEAGTGKELVARALHDRGPRRSQPFVAINCASFPDTLLEAELFGYA